MCHQEKTRKIVDIWQKGSTFPQPCLDELKVKLANAMASAGSSKYVDGAGVKKELKSSSLASGESKGSGKSFSQSFFFLLFLSASMEAVYVQ